VNTECEKKTAREVRGNRWKKKKEFSFWQKRVPSLQSSGKKHRVVW